MKRFFAALLAALMVFSLVTIPAVAEGEVVFEVPTVNAQPGDTVSIPVTLTGSNFECHAMNMNVQYDAEALTLNSATEGDAISGATMKVLDTESELGKVKLGLLYAYDGMTAGGTLFTMNFTVNENATGNAALTINVVTFANMPAGSTTATPIAYIANNGAVVVGQPVTPIPETDTPAPVTPIPETPAPGEEMTLDEALNVAGGTLTFTSEGDYPWIVDGDAAKSTNVNVASSTSTVSTTVTAAAGDILRFDFMSFGEGSSDYVWDGLHLTVDGTEVMKWSRVETWTTYAVELTAGEHTVAWSYQKDGSVDKEGDYATVDNVYVGAPVTPNAINVEAVSVPAGRRATVAYTVLPAEAFNKNVTFSTANTAIATVNENGVVVGVAEGTTTVTVTSVADPTVSGSATVTVTEALPTVNLEGYIAFDPEGTSGIWGGFADYDPSVIENFGTMGSTFGGAFAGGNVYGFMYDSDTNDTRFYIMNADTHQVAYPGTSAGRVVVAMAYNHAEGEMYAIAVNDADGRSLYTVNLATGTLTEVAALNGSSDTIMTLAIDGSGNAYGLSYEATNAVLYSINLTNGNCTAIGGTGHGLEHVQAMTWDHNTNQMFWAQYSNVDNDKGQLFFIDPATGAATLCGTIGTGAEVTVLYTKNNMPVAPIEVPEYNVTFVDGLTNETIPGGYIVEAGTVLDEADFPAAPAHEGYEFTGWDYNGAPVYSDITVKARYRDPNATTATITLTVGDVFGDGSGYQMLLDADATAYGNEIPASGPLTTGGDAPAGLYDAFEYKIPVNADGSCSTSNVVVNKSVTIEIPGGVYDWCLTNPTPGDRIWIASNQGNVGGRADDYEFVAGNTYNFTVYLLGQNDATDVEIIPGGGTPNTPVPPTENPNTPEPGTTTGWGFETDPFAEGWTIRDDDGDGYNWEWMEGSGSDYNVYEGTHCMASASYQNSAFGGGTALNPDNWLISPAFTAGSTVTFWYAGQDPNYAAEPFGVYVIANGTASDELGHFTASNTYQQGSVDISDFAGQTVQVAFRHYGITDMFRLNLDLVEVSGGGGTPNTPVPPTTIPEPTLVPLDVTFSAAAPASVAAGEEFQVAVNIGGVIDYEAHVLNLRLDYDTDAFEYLHDEPGAVMNQMIENSGTAILDGFSIPGSIRFGAMMPNAGFTAYGTLFTLTFRAKADAANGEHNFDLNVVEFNNFPMGGTSTPIEHTDVDAIVEVTGGSTVTPTPTEVPTPGPGSDLDEAMNVAGGTLHFTTDGDYPWIVEETWGKSTNVNVASSTSTVSTTVTAAAGDILQFDFMSFGEGAGDYVWDGLHLTVDGTEVMKWSRVETWTTYAVELTAGEHTVAWSYQKDGSVDKEGDYATVDNVYVGAPVTPNAINVEAVSVPAGRRATVAYTVLPAEAFNKNVTFSTANTAIATVNENGVVVGVAEGTTTVTVTSVADPTVSGSATVTVTEALPTVNLEGYIAFDPEGTSGIWGGFADYDPSVIENFGTMGSTFGGAFAGGNVYGFMYDSDTNDTRFYIMNADTHQVAYPGTSAGRVVVAMAYNHAEGEMYAIAVNDADGRSLYTVNLATGTLTEVAALNGSSDTIMTLAIDGSGNAYGLSYAATNAVLYSINLTNGNCTAIGGTGHGLEYVQSTVWDHNTNQLFWAQYSKVETDKGQLFVIDPATGAATLCGTIGTGAEVTVLYTKNNMPVAPIEVPEYDVIFVDGLTNEPIPGGYTVEAGTILDEADFPTPPEHEGYVFTGWDYNGAPVYSDLTIKARYRDPSATTATISLTVGDVWGDGSGYQMLLDADATAFGNEIPAQGPLTTGGDAPAGLYDAFEYKIPVNADGSTTTSNIVINNTITIEVPAGTYDWCITNPTPGDRIWIASAQGNIGGRADDYEFEAGYTYNFTVYLLGQNDATDVEIIPGGGETPVITDSPTPVITNSPTPEPPTDTPEPGDETPTPEIPTDTPEPVTPAPGDVIFSVGGVHYVAAGSQVSVDLTINGEYEANGMNIWVQYDAEKLTLNSVDEGEIMKAIKDLGGMNILDFQSIPGSVRLGSMLPTDPVSGSGKIFTMNFTVAEGLEDGTEMPIEILVKEFFNMPVGGENTPIAFFAENGSIVVGSEPIVTDEPGVTDEPTAVPTDAPNPPITGAMSLIGVGIAAIVASAGVVIFRKKEED